MTPITITQRAQFIPHDGFSRTMSQADQLAELISSGMTIGSAALRLGLTYDAARKVWREIRG